MPIVLIAMLTRPREKSPPDIGMGIAQRAFTLVELLVVMVIMAIVLAIALPPLKGSREAARESRLLSTMRQLGQAIDLYTRDNAQLLPCVVQRGDPYAVPVVRGHAVSWAYFTAQARLWINLVFPDYLDGPIAQFERPGIRDPENLGIYSTLPEELVRNEFLMTFTSAASYSYWRDDAFGNPISLSFSHLRGQRLDDISHPSRKGLIIHGKGLSLVDARGLCRVVRGDGSAATEQFADLTPTSISRPFGANPGPVLTTRDGLNGID
ncbi:MAG: type II secretion system protein [Phycisphaeraceae bacterium]|nr:type II secretion system protein [Phycisphaeraceae bacterium]MCW5753544.1 type II secretion system protein [Phycisphaeraceae bacterium]